MTALQDRLAALLVSDFGVPAGDVRPDVPFADLGLDSLALIEFTMVIKKETGAVLDDDALQPKSTLADVVGLIETATAQAR